MSRKRIIQIAVLVFLSLAIIFFLPIVKWKEMKSIMALVSLVFATLASIVSIFIPNTYTYNFNISDWKKVEDNHYYLEIKSIKHGVGKTPQIQTFLRNDDGYELVGVHEQSDGLGNVTVTSSSTFNGKIILK